MAPTEICRLDRNYIETSSFADMVASLTDRERVLSSHTAFRMEPVPRVVPVQARGVTVNFKYIDNGEPRPAWFMSVLQSFANLATLHDGWDAERARRIDRPTINRALAAIEQLLPAEAPAPSVVPLQNAGLQIEWHHNRRDLEIEFDPSGKVEFYYFDEQTEEEYEGTVDPSFTTVKDYLTRIW
jgi:hypothetical protein